MEDSAANSSAPSYSYIVFGDESTPINVLFRIAKHVVERNDGKGWKEYGGVAVEYRMEEDTSYRYLEDAEVAKLLPRFQ